MRLTSGQPHLMKYRNSKIDELGKQNDDFLLKKFVVNKKRSSKQKKKRFPTRYNKNLFFGEILKFSVCFFIWGSCLKVFIIFSLFAE